MNKERSQGNKEIQIYLWIFFGVLILLVGGFILGNNYNKHQLRLEAYASAVYNDIPKYGEFGEVICYSTAGLFKPIRVMDYGKGCAHYGLATEIVFGDGIHREPSDYLVQTYNERVGCEKTCGILQQKKLKIYEENKNNLSWIEENVNFSTLTWEWTSSINLNHNLHTK